ncbi:MAG: 1,6-anhydro-N-acetylmuramyl-L-alanine amidase AmpD [Brachymonas sp.]|jgi:AmpD protein
MTKNLSPSPAALRPTWQRGWWAYARHLPSPNFGARPAGVGVDLVVLHSISLPPAQYGTGCVQQLFCNQLDWDAHPYFQQIRGAEVSAHFFIERGGEVWQFVACDDRAWHAGKSSFQGRENCNDYSIGIELEGIEGGAFEDAQYESLLALLSDLQLAYPTIAAVTGHEHIAPGRKADPGAGFDWQRVSKGANARVYAL